MKSLCEWEVAKSGVVMVVTECGVEMAVAESFVVVVAKNESECRMAPGLWWFLGKECWRLSSFWRFVSGWLLFTFSWVTVRMMIQVIARLVQGGGFCCTELLLWADWCRKVPSPVQIQWV